MNRNHLLLLILGLSLLSGSVCMHPATVRVTEMPGSRWNRIPDNYYNYAPVIPTGMDAYEWLSNLGGWAQDYEQNDWDCSMMAAYLEWVLENAGIPTKIQVGYGHAWLLIWRGDKGKWWAYECVGLYWVPPWAEGRYYDPEHEHDSIREAKEFYGRFHTFFAQEWCWWTDTSALWITYNEEY